MDRELASIGTRNHGVLTRADLISVGLSSTAIHRRVEKGLLLREYSGVYRLGHRAPSLEAEYLAAVRACGNDAVLSGRAAAVLFGMLKGRPSRAEVTTRTYRRIPGIRTRRVRLHPSEVVTVRRIPVTSVPRTLVDLAAELPIDDLALACHEAGVRYRTKPRHIAAILALREKRPPGIGKLRLVMVGDVHVVLSKLERGFVWRLRQGGLPLPVTNRIAGGHYVDCRWPEYRLTVELQSYRFHNSRHSWEQDHDRRREARARGDDFRTYTWADVFEDSTLMLEELRELLALVAPRRRRSVGPRTS